LAQPTPKTLLGDQVSLARRGARRVALIALAESDEKNGTASNDDGFARKAERDLWAAEPRPPCPESGGTYVDELAGVHGAALLRAAPQAEQRQRAAATSARLP
jgi:hypothetical protein